MRGISKFFWKKSSFWKTKYVNIFEKQRTTRFEIPGRYSKHIIFINLGLADQRYPALPSSIHVGFKSTQFKSGFVGENLTLEEYESLKEEEKVELTSIFWEKNRDWLRQKFQELNAKWLTVVDGEVETFSSDINEYPQESDILHICQEKGKFPLTFVNPRLLMIE